MLSLLTGYEINNGSRRALEDEMGECSYGYPSQLDEPKHKLRHSLSLSLTLIIFISLITGRQVGVKIVENKRALPFRTAQFELEFEKGNCKVTEIIELSIKHTFNA
ncbi:DNA repair protein recA-like protein 3 [Raphanus sativus]|nr:DNA repair protein recA-like protein 3 [Raphanus sativus]